LGAPNPLLHPQLSLPLFTRQQRHLRIYRSGQIRLPRPWHKHATTTATAADGVTTTAAADATGTAVVAMCELVVLLEVEVVVLVVA
jgi:hypothetical protein